MSRMGPQSEPFLGIDGKVFFPENMPWIRPYVEALSIFCKVLEPVANQYVPLILATPERPYAVQVAELIRDGKVFQPGALPLPAMALTYLDTQFDDSRAHSWHFRKLQYTHDKEDVWIAPYPEPYNLLFTLDVRSKYNSEIWRIMEVYQKKWRRKVGYLTIDMGPFGIQSAIRVETSEPRDTSNLEPGDDTERAIRKTWNITVFGWLVLDAERVKTIRGFNLVEQNPETEEVYGEWVERFPIPPGP